MSVKRYKSISIILLIIIATLLGVILYGCGNNDTHSAVTDEDSVDANDDLIVVGFSQLGAESDWRSSNTQSMISEFTEENGYKLIFEDAQQKQTNQITAIRSFIQQEVDYIVVAPVTETGWDTVLSEAKEAGIPVIIIDRQVDVSNDDLFTAWVGSNFELEGEKVCKWIDEYTRSIGVSSKDIHIVDIQGTKGSSAQIGRTNGFRNAATEHGWDIVAYADGDFTQTKGRESMFEILRTYSDVNVVYCENDNEALGVIEALEATGRTVGSDIAHGEVMVVSFDGVNEEAFSNLAEGKISCIGECNPDSGPKVRAIIEQLQNGSLPMKYEYLDESVFSSREAVKTLSVNGANYEVTIVTPEDLKAE